MVGVVTPEAPTLDDVFKALADPTRLSVIEWLGDADMGFVDGWGAALDQLVAYTKRR